MGLDQPKKIPYSKENHEQQKETYGMGGNICKPYIQQGVNIQNLQRTNQIQNPKKKSMFYFPVKTREEDMNSNSHNN